MVEFPPAGYVAVESAVDGIEVYAPAPEAPEAEPDVTDFKCPQCQATTAYSVADGGLRCAHCGYYAAPETEVVGKGATEFEFTVATVAAAREAQGWGTARKQLACDHCGARTSLPPAQLTHTCPFCGSNRVLQQDAPQDQLRPRFLIPFRIEAQQCRQIARTWLGSSWMTPKALKENGDVVNFEGVYVPYWTFDARTRAPWRAQVGHQVTERYYDHSSKSWKTRTKTVWRWESGEARQGFDDLLMVGTQRLSPVLLDRMSDFDTQALTPYDAAYLAGFMAQAYDVPLETAWEAGREVMREQTRQACRRQASTSQIRNFSMTLDFADESWRYVLVPVYVAAYRYGGETYQVMVNGQTGTVAGQRPVDWTKVWLAAGAMVAPGLLLGLLGLLAAALGLVLPPSMVVGGGVLVVAFILLVIGGVFAAITVSKAMKMDDV
jgi:DNA-directed RNA polymerase subunit RPC12/RpoP